MQHEKYLRTVTKRLALLIADLIVTFKVLFAENVSAHQKFGNHLKSFSLSSIPVVGKW